VLEILCECGDEACAKLIPMRTHDYEQILASPSTFVVCEGHEELDVERVTARMLDYAVVEKLGTVPPPRRQEARRVGPRDANQCCLQTSVGVQATGSDAPATALEERRAPRLRPGREDEVDAAHEPRNSAADLPGRSPRTRAHPAGGA